MHKARTCLTMGGMDVRAEVTERLAARTAAFNARVAARAALRRQLKERRDAGLKARHAAKLVRQAPTL